MLPFMCIARCKVTFRWHLNEVETHEVRLTDVDLLLEVDKTMRMFHQSCNYPDK